MVERAMNSKTEPQMTFGIEVDRRGSRRQAMSDRPLAVYLSDDDNVQVDVLGRNISMGGLLFISPRPVGSGERVEVHLLGADGFKEIVSARVTRCEVADASSFAVAVKFDRPISPKCFDSGADLPA